MRAASAIRFASLALLLAPSAAIAQTGVSDDRVSLSDGPGSRDGIGDNASLDGNMGLMSYAVPFEVTEGYAGATPSLGLSYSSGGGTSLVGIGWSFGTASIERYTAKGLPSYTADDRFSFGPSQELVRTDSSAPNLHFYRARFEGGFVRFAWHEVGDGTEGYWTAEAPDGSISYFGADSNGVLVPSARLGGAEGTFRYMITETVDVWGHRLVYSYDAQGGSVPLIDTITYAFTDNENATGPRATVTFDYALRPDLISDAHGGFEELTAHRLTGVNVLAGAVRVRRYALAYEDFDTAGGLSRLARVSMYGSDDGLYPMEFSFSYSQGLGGSCTGDACAEPVLVQMGSLGINLQSGTATLMDMNGDGVPDVLETPVGQSHRIFLSVLDTDGAHSFDPPFTTAQAGTSAHALSSPYVQPLDVNGDGYTDLLNAQSGEALLNRGSGDWSGLVTLGGAGTTTLPDFGSDLNRVRFLDYDLDRKIDIIRADAGGTSVFQNLGDGGFESDPNVDDIEAGFVENGLQLADMNGDGLLDPTLLLEGQVQFRVNLGRGHFSEWRTIENAPIGAADFAFSSLEDLNGDGIEDIVIVRADEVSYALNRNAAEFETPATLTSAGGQSLPTRDATTAVLFADMNANGSDDIVWIDGNGAVTYLELFPVRPNLITRIENAIGNVIDVTYTSSALERAESPLAWSHPTPSPMLLVDAMDTWVELDSDALEQHNLSSVSYQNAYYDSEEKQFRGYEIVVATQLGDDTRETLTTRSIYDLGLTSPARAGLVLAKESYGEDGRLERSAYSYEDCSLTGVPTNLTPPIEWVCRTGSLEQNESGDDEAAYVTVASTVEWDGYGNTTTVEQLGVVGLGPDSDGACAPCDRDDDVGGAPCGAQCLGDEHIVTTTFVPPALTPGAVGGWLLRLPQQVSSSTGLGRDVVARHFYDGAAFEGLPAGQATRGALTRTEVQMDDGVIHDLRVRFDDHGNVIESLDPRGNVASEGFRTRFFFDALGLELLAEERDVTHTTDAGEEAIVLRRESTSDPVHDELASVTEWFVVGDASPSVTTYSYDEFGRPASVVYPGGDTAQSPSVSFSYEIAAPLSRTIERRRSVVGGPQDIVTVTCTDGRSRSVVTKGRVADDRWQAVGVSVYNAYGQVVRQSEPFEASSDACTAVAPAGTLVSTMRYDALGRGVSVTDRDDGTTPSVRETRHGPLWAEMLDEEAVAGTGSSVTRTSFDGLGRPVRIERGSGGDATAVEITWDDLGGLRGWRDAFGHERVQERDLKGRVVRVLDSVRGTLDLTYDAAGNPIREQHANGDVLVRSYDELDRKTAEWSEADEDGTKAQWSYDRLESCPLAACGHAATKLVRSRMPLDGFGDVERLWGYDARMRGVEERVSVLGAALSVATTFDNADRASAVRWPDGRVVDIALDPLDRVTAVPGIIDEVTWDARNLLASFRGANGVTTTRTHDARRRLVGLSATGAGGDVLGHSITRDGTGNVVELDDSVESAASMTRSYRYDSALRLTSAVLGDETLTWGFDAGERLVSKNSTTAASAEHVGDLGYDAVSGALSSVGDAAVVADASGQLLSVPVGAEVLTLGYDHRGLLISAARGDVEVGAYRFDAERDRLIRKAGSSLELTPFGGFEVRDGISRLLVSLPTGLVYEEESAALATSLFSDEDGDGAITAADAWLARDSEDARTMLRSAARRALLTDEDSEAADRAWLHVDDFGTLLAVTGEDSAVRERLSYGPTGLVRAATAGATEYARYADHDIDTESGLVSFGARSLIPSLGVFSAPDPARAILASNAVAAVPDAAPPYTYARNNAATLLDVGGLFGFTPERLREIRALGVWAPAGSQPLPIRVELSKASMTPVKLTLSTAEMHQALAHCPPPCGVSSKSGNDRVGSVVEQAAAPAPAHFTLGDAVPVGPEGVPVQLILTDRSVNERYWGGDASDDVGGERLVRIEPWGASSDINMVTEYGADGSTRMYFERDGQIASSGYDLEDRVAPKKKNIIKRAGAKVVKKLRGVVLGRHDRKKRQRHADRAMEGLLAVMREAHAATAQQHAPRRASSASAKHK